MAIPEEIRKLKEQQGWSDKTLLGLLLQWAEEFDQVEEIAEYLDAVAADENDDDDDDDDDVDVAAEDDETDEEDDAKEEE